MNDIRPADRRWHLRDGDFDERTGILRVGGKASELDRSCRAILSLLLQNAGARVGKEQLLEAGWPATIVHENSLAKAIGRLREALGGQADLLKAVYGVGYQLDAAVLASPHADEGRSGDRIVSEISPGAARRRAMALVAILGFAALLVTSIALWEARSPAAVHGQLRSDALAIADAPDAIGKVLWVDDHPENNIEEKRFFESHKIAVHPVTNSADALKLLAIYDYKAVISDMGRGEDRLAGARFVQQMRANNDRTPVIIYTVRADGPAKQQAQRNLVAESGAQALAVTPQEVQGTVLGLFGNPRERTAD